MTVRISLRRGALAVCLLYLPVPAAGQDPMARAFDFERLGRYEDAARVYRTILGSHPTDLGALLGLERALTPINRLAVMLPETRRALAQAPVPPQVFSLALRTYAAAGLNDSIPQLVDRWARASPGDESPFREWGVAALQNRDREAARLAYRTARERLGRPDALAAEVAQLAVLDENWTLAAHEWAQATRQLPGYRTSAATMLGQAPEPARPSILKVLQDDGEADVARIAVDLRARWGDPVGAYEQLQRVLPRPSAQQIEYLQAFLEAVRRSDGAAYRRAQALALESLAERWTAPAQRARFRLDAARAYADAGDLVASRRLLAQLAADTAGNRSLTTDATAALIELLVQDGNLEEASHQLLAAERPLGVDEYLRLRRLVALGWARSGAVDRARSLVAADSTVEGSALRGWISLFAGDLKATVTEWQEAGPFAGPRAEATDRAAILALLQRVQDDSLPSLGQAYRLLAEGDTVGAAEAFDSAASQVPLGGGGAEILERAGELYRHAGRAEDAERVLRTAVTPVAPGAAAAALLELGRLFLATDRRDEAVQVLERLVLEYSGSALVPQARRLLDQAHQAIPAT